MDMCDDDEMTVFEEEKAQFIDEARTKIKSVRDIESVIRHDKCTVSEIFRMSNCTEINSTHQVTEILLRLCNQNLVVRTEEKSRPFYSIAR